MRLDIYISSLFNILFYYMNQVMCKIATQRNANPRGQRILFDLALVYTIKPICVELAVYNQESELGSLRTT